MSDFSKDIGCELETGVQVAVGRRPFLFATKEF
jgi:hypothetical protein